MEKILFEYNETDRAVTDIYADFLPKRIFDAHMHVYYQDLIPSFSNRRNFAHEMVSPKEYWADMRHYFPGVDSFCLNMMPMPDPEFADNGKDLRVLANSYVESLCREDSNQVCCSFVMPEDSEETIERMADGIGVRGLKCYCYGRKSADYSCMQIEEFLPEAAWRVAERRRLPIILHLMRKGALSDDDNFAYISRMTKRYPNAQLVLAHCASAFASWTTVNKIRALEDFGNIWFDISAICESGAIIACFLKNAGKRTMWGSDYPVCLHRGRPIAIAGAAQWLTDQSISVQRTRVIAENLLAVHEAATLLDLDQTQIDDLFYRNATELFKNNKIME